MNELLDTALKTLKHIENAHDIRHLREYVRKKRGLAAKLHGIVGGFEYYEGSSALDTAETAVEKLDEDDLLSFAIVVELVDDLISPKPGGDGRGHVQIKTIKRSYPQWTYEDGETVPILDADGEQVYLDLYYPYAYIRLHSGKGDKDRHRRRLMSIYVDQGIGAGGVVAAALEQNLITEEDILNAYFSEEEGAYARFLDQVVTLHAAQNDDEAGESGAQGAAAKEAGKSGKAGTKASTTKADYLMRIELVDVKPAVWRRFRVPSDLSFRELHEIVQIVMGWEDYHQYQFLVGKHAFKDDLPGHEDLPASQSIKRHLKVDQPFSYEYDFGDLWQHDLVVEKSLPSSGEGPACLAGKHACPPEDSGGTENFIAYLAARKKKRVPAWLKEQIGARFDPDAFNLGEVNAALKDYWTEREKRHGASRTKVAKA